MTRTSIHNKPRLRSLQLALPELKSDELQPLHHSSTWVQRPPTAAFRLLGAPEIGRQSPSGAAYFLEPLPSWRQNDEDCRPNCSIQKSDVLMKCAKLLMSNVGLAVILKERNSSSQ